VRIGITTSYPDLVDGAPHRKVAPYVRAVERAGAVARLLPNDAGAVDSLLGSVDGLVFGGGVDVEPARYGGNPDHGNSEAGDYRRDRDAFEIALVQAARERLVPTLCICRGMQIANVAFGGTLIEDLGDHFGGGELNHRQTDEAGVERYDYAAGHEVTLDPASALARLVGATTLATNSMHHQAVRALGDGLVAVGRTRDGIVEAAELTLAHPFFYAVQWHPEELDDAPSRALFSGLVRAAAAFRMPRAGSTL
jgi:putative glutamine amidotransferase